ncbi:MAG: response regulator [Magnetococcales bacterium]|nr:response regulator [Magnetococcales bacterium]
MVAQEMWKSEPELQAGGIVAMAPLVMIAGPFGSGMEELAVKLAHRMGVPHYDSDKLKSLASDREKHESARRHANGSVGGFLNQKQSHLLDKVDVVQKARLPDFTSTIQWIATHGGVIAGICPRMVLPGNNLLRIQVKAGAKFCARRLSLTRGIDVGAADSSLVLVYLEERHRQFLRALSEDDSMESGDYDLVLDAESTIPEEMLQTCLVLLEQKGMMAKTRTGHVAEVTGGKMAEPALFQSREQTAAVAKAKEELLATISHEIRTPMNVVLGMSEMLLETDLDPMQRRFAQTMHQSGRALMAVINDVLDFSRMDAGRIHLTESPFSPRQVVEETAHLLRLAAEEKGLTLREEIAPEIPEAVLGDEGRVRQVLINLLSNAIKFTHHGQLGLRLTRHPAEPETLLFQVTDTGIGIASEQAGNIFEHFTQAGPGGTRNYGGSGLGLAISRRLVELMGGRIGVESRLNVGSTFSFTLPMRTVTASVVRSPSVGQEAVPETADWKGLRILLAEDAKESQILFDAYCMQTPHQLVMVNDGMEAVDRVQEEPFDVVIMDIQMPRMDGYTATRLIRQWEREKSRSPVPIIALSAHAMEGEMERSREAGCSLYLPKPISKRELHGVLQQIAGRAVCVPGVG